MYSDEQLDNLRELYNEGYTLGFNEGKEGNEYTADAASSSLSNEEQSHYNQGYAAGYSDGQNVRAKPIPATTVPNAAAPPTDQPTNLTVEDAEKPHEVESLTEVTEDGSVVTHT